MPYELEEVPYGYKIIVSGFFDSINLKKMRFDLEIRVSGVTSPFSLNIDLRGFEGDVEDIKFILDYIHFSFLTKDLQRVAVVVSGMDKVTELKQIAEKRNIRYERYIDSEFYSDWSFRAQEWVEDGKDPYLRTF